MADGAWKRLCSLAFPRRPFTHRDPLDAIPSACESIPPAFSAPPEKDSRGRSDGSTVSAFLEYNRVIGLFIPEIASENKPLRGEKEGERDASLMAREPGVWGVVAREGMLGISIDKGKEGALEKSRPLRCLALKPEGDSFTRVAR